MAAPTAKAEHSRPAEELEARSTTKPHAAPITSPVASSAGVSVRLPGYVDPRRAVRWLVLVWTAGIALGFGAQSIVRDFLSGFFMLVEDQFAVGDIIDVGEASGVVENISLRTTQVRDINGTLWYVPNGEIHRVANKSQQWARAVLDIEVAYDTDIENASRVIKEVADQVWHEHAANATIIEEPEIWGVEMFGESSIAIRLVCKVEPGEQWMTSRVIRRRVKEAFDREGIEIPFPQRVVWTRSEEP